MESTRPPVVAVIGAANLVSRLVPAIKEAGYNPIVPDDGVELQHEPSVRRWIAYVMPDVLVICQDRVEQSSASMLKALLTCLHGMTCSVGLVKGVLFTGVWPDPEFWQLLNVGEMLRREDKLDFRYYLKHPKKPAMLDWVADSVLSLREFLPPQEANAKSPQSAQQKDEVRDEVVPE